MKIIVKCSLVFLLVLFISIALVTAENIYADGDFWTDETFSLVVLGSRGGPRIDDVSGFMIWPVEKPEEAIVFDPGVLTVGIRKADEKNNLWDFRVPEDSNLTREGWILQNIKAYLVSHAHLDHIAAMVINSPEDSAKDIIATDTTLTHLQDNIFNWEIWPNFGDAGPEPHLGQYSYVSLNHMEEMSINNTSMNVQAFELMHDPPTKSTAFLIEHDENYMLLFGDTGPDEIQETDHLNNIWHEIAPLIREDKLKGILLEVAYTSDRPDGLLFGHFTPKWMMEELNNLAEIVDPDNPEEALEGLSLLVTHIKPKFVHEPTPRQVIEKELNELNNLGINFIIPYQGHRYNF